MEKKKKVTFACGSLVYKSVHPNMNGGFTIKMMPPNTSPMLIKSVFKMGSFKNHLAKNTVNIGDVAEIIITSAIGKC